jgi:hypothetical protein
MVDWSAFQLGMEAVNEDASGFIEAPYLDLVDSQIGIDRLIMQGDTSDAGLRRVFPLLWTGQIHSNGTRAFNGPPPWYRLWRTGEFELDLGQIPGALPGQVITQNWTFGFFHWIDDLTVGATGVTADGVSWFFAVDGGIVGSLDVKFGLEGFPGGGTFGPLWTFQPGRVGEAADQFKCFERNRLYTDPSMGEFDQPIWVEMEPAK